MRRYTINITMLDGSRIEAKAIGNSIEGALEYLLSQTEAKIFVDECGGMKSYKLMKTEPVVPVANDLTRFLIQRGSQPGWWVATDKKNQIVVQWQQGRYEQTRKATPLKEHSDYGTLELATFLREIGEWIALYHKEKI